MTCTDAVGNLVATYVDIDWRQLGLPMTLNVLEGHSPITSSLSGILVQFSAIHALPVLYS